MENVILWIDQHLGISPAIQARMVMSLLICLLLWFLRRMVVRAVWSRTDDVRTRYVWRKSSAYAAFFLGVVLVGRLWLPSVHSVATFLGLFSAGVAIALKDPVSNLAGWLFIIWRRPFELQDRIQVGDVAGDVIDIAPFQFTLLEIGNWVQADQSTGRVVALPNSKVFTEPVANYGRGFQFIWNEIPVLITFESNWERARELLLQIGKRHAENLSEAAARRIREAARKYLIFYSKLTPIVYVSVRDSGVLLTLRFLCEPRRRRGVETAIWEDVLREFRKCDDLDFAYPTQRFYNNAVEGKPGAGGGVRHGPSPAGAETGGTRA